MIGAVVREDPNVLAETEKTALTAIDAASEIARGAMSAEEYVRDCLDRIAASEPKVQAFAHIDTEYALRQARERDEWRQSGRPIGPLHGVPVGIKDIIDTADYPTECGSAFLSGRRPTVDATVVSRLRAAGAVIIGKTVTTEFAYFSPGKTRNPRDPERTPGGSSSGSAAAVAAQMVPLALGTQTNGSIIRPGSFCGVFAMKPSHGLVSRAGVLSLSRTLDHVGPFARSIDDLALALDVIAGHDAEDPDTRPIGARNFRETAAENFPLPPRFAFVRTSAWDKADLETREAFEGLAEELGDACVEYKLPDEYAAAWDSQRIIMATEMAHNLGGMVDRGGELISKTTGDLIAEGRAANATKYLNAVAAAAPLREGLNQLFHQQFNAIISPASPGAAPKGTATGNPAFCTLWTYVGLPAITIPLMTSSSGMPIGVQLVGAFGDDARLLRTAKALVKKLSEN
ncbi:MAG TPA: amidase [Pseudolabrys sp.]|nr:amidase [Pseudolabrys sp.]